ncbi:hypothetical protein CKM354_001260700 [Cercospora kikuchii]|uniref:Ribosome biogenesis protein YTM1 n=1 Tax=Cercospora kikuchii TaxID=84275 RepID=A0A9P3FMB6_9PEZI|nr:uncharacterized protein CKM354_001260700 [Cercospora kikuchii]GIZ49577.1 hypothetical protein CKM354_001260700 [Cercospora kikuchii]
MAASTEAQKQVKIRLSAKDDSIALPQEVGDLVISTEVKRYQLSTLVNKLLETTQPTPFEFLINGQYLRTTLDEFLTENGISAETTLHVEYVKALSPPQYVASYEHDDWVSSVDVLSSSSNAANWANVTGNLQSSIVSASFDGALRVWNESQDVLATGIGWHRGSIHAAKWLSPSQVVTAGTDRSVRLWEYAAGAGAGSAKLSPKLELLGHKGAIDSLAVHAPSSRILTASADNRIGFWSSKKSEGTNYEPPTAPSSKRRKLSGPAISTPQRGALAYLEGHTQHVKDVVFDSRDHTVAYSASIDHSVKTWDLTTSTCVNTRSTNQALLSVCHLPEQTGILAGGALNRIDLIDLRASASKVAVLSCRGHKNWVRSLSLDPESPFRFVSGSDDSTCRIWDLRSTSQEAAGGTVAKPVYTIDRESEKGKKVEQGSESSVYSVSWNKEIGIVAGGMDKMLQINRAPS